MMPTLSKKVQKNKTGRKRVIQAEKRRWEKRRRKRRKKEKKKEDDEEEEDDYDDHDHDDGERGVRQSKKQQTWMTIQHTPLQNRRCYIICITQNHHFCYYY